MRVESVEYVWTEDEFVYDLTVENTHTYLVSESDVVVHNCGVGFKPVIGLLTGLPKSLTEVKFIPSIRTEKGGAEDTVAIIDREASTWTIRLGDSAKAWAKMMGMLLGDKPRVKTLILDFSELRPGGKRLKGYGWLSSGWEPLAKALSGIIKVLQARGNDLLTRIDIGDIINWLGTVLSSRRAAEAWIEEVNETTWEDILANHGDFIDAKTDRWARGEGQREQSNNTLVFNRKPERRVIVELLRRILTTGDPGFANGAAARLRAPEIEGFNPCFEILLPSKGFCNLMQVVWHRFNGDFEGLMRAQWIAARANYRQTCVSMRDGVLQLQWNDNQKLLRLCGVSPTGYVSWEHMNEPEALEIVANSARNGANSMADDLGLQRPRRVTQCQPSGTGSKALGIEGDEVHEGAHLALSRWIFNNINFSKFDPILKELEVAGYKTRPNPVDPTGVLVTFPVEYPPSSLFTKVTREVPNWLTGDMETHHLEINQESAVSQLERYRILMKHYIDHNCSITVSYDLDEIHDMADWFMENWDSYVGVSFLQRNDPMKTAEDLGFHYLPQESVSRETYQRYIATLLPVDLDHDKSEEILDMGDCGAGGSCPIR